MQSTCPANTKELLDHIIYMDLSKLKPSPRNARTHSPQQIRKLADSIKEFGFVNPILVDEKNTILAGHGRAEAAKQSGIIEVPTLCISHLNELQKRAYILADNRLAEQAGWDKELVALELQELISLDFDIEVTGFSTIEADINLDADEDEDKPVIPPDDYQAISKTGDIWVLGSHRLICGDATKADDYSTLMAGESAQMVFADPPYNLAIGGCVKRRTDTSAKEFVMASGEMNPAQFTLFLRSFLQCTSAHLQNGAISYVCMDWRHMQELLNASRELLEFKQLCVWTKNRPAMGTFYRSQHELVFVFKYGSKPHINNFKLGANGRNRSNVWQYPVVHSSNLPEIEDIEHPTVKPVSLVMDALRDCSKRGGILLDPYGGSGTSLIAAEKTERKARLIELDPVYCDMTIRRWEKLTGKKATLTNGVTHG